MNTIPPAPSALHGPLGLALGASLGLHLVALAWQIGAPLLAVIASMAICSGLILWAGASPLSAWGLLLKGALGSTFALTETASFSRSAA